MSEAVDSQATLVETSGAAVELDAPLTRGDTIGRYVLLGRLGAGGMGVVYGAYDPELDRKVALKMLRPGRAAQGGVGSTRLLREAQALARLSHPNAVAVHDVGTHGDDVWSAMEFVAGRTLGQWLEERSRTWREVLEVVRPAAQGLAAAHESGLVHRDVKPDNVMLGDDGRVRVMDFGLAQGVEHEQPLVEDETITSHRRVVAFAARLTLPGATPGTPAYMSPEQILGDRTDGRTDQFSLCVMLWEALYGELPFDGRSLAELATNIVEGERRPAPRGIAVPKWLGRVMERGLAVHPEDRWPSLEAFLQALDRGRLRTRVSRSLAGISIVALAGAGVWGVQELDEKRRIAACEEAGAGIEDVWNADVRERLREGLLATGAGHAATTAAKVMPWLDGQADAWRNARTEACLDRSVRKVWDADMLDRSVWCLDDRRFELGALADQLTHADVKAVTKAVQAAAGLRQVEPCRDGVLLSRLPAPPTEARDEVQAVRAELSEADALTATGAYAKGLEVARESLGRADGIGWSPLKAAARVRVGDLLEESGAYEEAVATQEAAYFEAAKAGAIEEALSAANELVFVVSYRLARHAEGERWVRHADVMRSALPDPADLRKATSLSNLGFVRRATGGYEEAARLHERALDILEKALGPEHPDVATSLCNLANVRFATGGYEEAARLHERALGIREKTLGPEHPGVALSLNNLANVRAATGAYDDAARLHERALDIQETALGPEHPNVAASLNNLANVYYSTGAYEEATRLYEQALGIREKALGPENPDVAASLGNLASVRAETGAYEEAATLYERALDILEKALGPEHPDVAKSLNNLANVREAKGAYEDAARLHERALDIREKALGPEHPDVATSLNNLANVRQATGAYEDATRLYERALGILEKALGPEHPPVAHPLIGLASVALAQGRAADAVPLAERAVKVRETNGVPSAQLANAQTVLARALMKTGTDRTRAVVLAEQARDAYRTAGDAHREALAETEAWLRKHGGGR